MRIVFYAGQCLPIHARTLEERPLGGTETAIIRLASSLASRMHQVVVCTSHQTPPNVSSNPLYVPHDRLPEVLQADVFVSIQDWRPLLGRMPVRKKYFWTGDSYDQFVNYGIGERRVHPKIDRFLAVSDWQARTLCEASGYPAEKAWVIRNGVHLKDFEGSEARNRKRMIFSSCPTRGLQWVAPLYAQLKQRHPDLELHVFAGLNIYDTDKPFKGPQVAAFQQILNGLKLLPGCVIHGNVLQGQLAREFMKSGLLFYPNTFTETSCITAMEAMAAGCPVISSASGALPETVGDCGLLVQGIPGSDEYTREFIAAADLLLSNQALWMDFSHRARARAFAEFSWERVADRFEALLRADFPGA